MDPLAPDYPWYTPYQFAGNTPIAAIDIDGLENFMTIDGNFIGAGPLSGSTILANHLKPTTEFEYAYKGQSHAELAVKNMQLRDMTYSGPQAYISQYQPTLDFGQQVARQLVTSAPVVAEELAELPYLAFYAAKGYITGDYTDAVYQAAAILMPAGVSKKTIKTLKNT